MSFGAVVSMICSLSLLGRLTKRAMAAVSRGKREDEGLRSLARVMEPDNSDGGSQPSNSIVGLLIQSLLQL